jgi:hypothetical protein
VVKHVRGNTGQTDAHLAVDMRVRVYPGTDAESPGVIVEDFGELAGPDTFARLVKNIRSPLIRQ